MIIYRIHQIRTTLVLKFWKSLLQVRLHRDSLNVVDGKIFSFYV